MLTYLTQALDDRQVI